MELVGCFVGLHRWAWSRLPSTEPVAKCANCGKITYDLSVMKDYEQRDKPSRFARQQNARRSRG